MKKTSKRIAYKFKANEFIKIWFSKDPDVFLPMVNQIRFINFILDHPGSAFHFIYKDSILSDKARKELLDFCKKFEVTPVNFDDIETVSIVDKQLKHLTNFEIDHAVNNKGGDLGAASDMARLMPNIIKLGFYLDFDTKAKFDQEVYIAKTPLLADVRSIELEDGSLNVRTNNQFIAVAKQKDGTLHKNADEALNDISKDLLNKYNSFGKIKIQDAEKTILHTILDTLSNTFEPILSIYRGFEKINIKYMDKTTLEILSSIFSIDLSYTSESFKTGTATTDNMLIKYILGKYFESIDSETPSIYGLRDFIKKCDNLIYKAKEFMCSEFASFGYNFKEVCHEINYNYDLTDHVIYSSFVIRVTGPQIFTNYMIANDQRNFLLDQNLTKAISSQDDKIEIEPGRTIDRDGDVSWFKEEGFNKSFLTKDRSKIFELEELSALNIRINKMSYTDPLFNILEEYLLLGCKEIAGGFNGLCKKFEDTTVIDLTTVIQINGDVANNID